MNPEASPNRFPVLALLRRRVEKPWVPRERHADNAAIQQVDDKTIVCTVDVTDASTGFKFRSSHTSPSARVPHSLKPCALPSAIPGRISDVVCEAHRLHPELRGRILIVHMNMRRFVRVVTGNVYAKAALSEKRRHATSVPRRANVPAVHRRGRRARVEV